MHISTHRIEKKYYKKQALKPVDLILEEGKVYGIFGPNGSGKTTLMKILSGLIAPSSGEVFLYGEKLTPKQRQNISYMPTASFLYPGMSIKEAGYYTEKLYGNFDKLAFSNYLKYFELEEKDRVKALSTGMMGRLKLSLALSRTTKFYMFDEPLNGIDPLSRSKIKDAIIESTSSEKTFLIASHLVYELESVVDEVIFIRQGEIILKEEADGLREKHSCSIEDLYKEVFANA